MSDSPVAIVTGASSGIGRAVAQQLIQAGYQVVLAARNQPRLDALVAVLGADRATARPCDVGDAQALTALIEAVASEHGRIDALVNVAGMALLKPLAETTVDEWDALLDVNLRSVFAGTRAAWPTFTQQQSGVIVNVSSMASKDPFPGLGAYAAAKVGVNMLTLVTAREGQPIGVKAVCVAPGAVETPMLRGMFEQDTLPADAALAPEQVGQLITDCITGARDFESGQTLFISK